MGSFSVDKKDLGVLNVEDIKVGASPDGRITQMGALSETERVLLNLPTHEIPAIAAALLGAAQEASKLMPAAEVIDAAARNVSGQLFRPIQATGFKREGRYLLVRIGFGMLTLELDDTGANELDEVCGQGR